MQPIASPQQQANPLLLGVSLSGNASLGEAVLQFWVKGRRANRVNYATRLASLT